MKHILPRLIRLMQELQVNANIIIRDYGTQWPQMDTLKRVAYDTVSNGLQKVSDGPKLIEGLKERIVEIVAVRSQKLTFEEILKLDVLPAPQREALNTILNSFAQIQRLYKTLHSSGRYVHPEDKAGSFAWAPPRDTITSARQIIQHTQTVITQAELLESYVATDIERWERGIKRAEEAKEGESDLL